MMNPKNMGNSKDPLRSSLGISREPLRNPKKPLGTVMKVTVQRCDYSIGARKSTRKLTKITETASNDISVMLPLPDCPRNSPKLEAR